MTKRGLDRPLPNHSSVQAIRSLTPEIGAIIPYRVVNGWDEEDEFDEWAKPSVPLTSLAEQIVGVTNQQLAGCRPTEVVLEEFLAFICF